MTMLGALVAGLNNLEDLTPVLQNLGKRHVEYNVKESDYSTVGTALLNTLSVGLGEAFTTDVENALTDVYGIIASVMINASKND